jgi:hypothetical protein
MNVSYRLTRVMSSTQAIALKPYPTFARRSEIEVWRFTLLSRASEQLRHQYNVLYRPEPLKTDGLYHPVDIRVKHRKDLVVRARHGYYAPVLQ